MIDCKLHIDPPPSDIRWIHDVFGNSVAIATFDRRATELYIASNVSMEHSPQAGNDIWVEEYARRFPFNYASEDMPDLLRSIERQHQDPWRKIDIWARSFLDGEADTLALLRTIATSIRKDFTYVPRHEKGTQTPLETLQKKQGTCRDFAVLMIDAVRTLGLAARFVSGYVYNPKPGAGRVGGGNTHAWVRVFLPGSGWVEFDPTNGIIGNHGLVRVAVARDPAQAVPLSGTWVGFPSSFIRMDVRVDIDMRDGRSPTPQEQVKTDAHQMRL